MKKNIEIITAYGKAIVRFNGIEERKNYRDALIFKLLQNDMVIALEDDDKGRKSIICVYDRQDNLVARIAPTMGEKKDDGLLDLTDENITQVAARIFA